MKRSAKKKIAYILTPVTYGGSEQVSLNLLKNISRELFEITPILIIRPWEKEAFFELQLKQLGFHYHLVPVARIKKYDFLRIPWSIYIILNLIRAGSFDLIHTNGYQADVIGFFVSKALGLPIISTCHGFIKEDLKLSFYNKVDLFLLKYFNKVIAVSDSISNFLLEEGIRRNVIVTIKNTPFSLNPCRDRHRARNEIRASLKVMEGEILLGCIGRLSREKGIIYALEAIETLGSKASLCRLALIGDGPEREKLMHFAQLHNLGDRVFFVGFQKNINEWMTALDIFLLPSLTEGTPMSLLEAMACGLPCIASLVGGVPQVIDSGHNGILVAPGDVVELRNAILTLCHDKTKRNFLAINARNDISANYDTATWSHEIEKQYLDVINSE